MPVLGILRSKIEAESKKGIVDAYRVFEQVLHAHMLPPLPPPATNPKISNARQADAMSTPLDGTQIDASSAVDGSTVEATNGKKTRRRRRRRKKPTTTAINDAENNTENTLEEEEEEGDEEKDVVAKKKNTRRHRRRRKPPTEQIVQEEQGDDMEASPNKDEDEGVEESTEAHQPTQSSDSDVSVVSWNHLPHRRTLREFSSFSSLKEIKTAIKLKWPEWHSNRYWLLLPNDTLVPTAPTPDEAIGILWAVGVVTKRHTMSSNDWKAQVMRDAVIKGLVEAMQLTPPRRLSTSSSSTGSSSMSCVGSGRVAPTTTTTSTKTTITTTTTATTTTTTTVTTTTRTTTRTPPDGGLNPPHTISPRAIPSAMFVLAWIGDVNNWMEEMSILCNLLEYTDFCRIASLNNVTWALRATRHYTNNLPLLERQAVALLLSMFPDQVHASGSLRVGGQGGEGGGGNMKAAAAAAEEEEEDEENEEEEVGVQDAMDSDDDEGLLRTLTTTETAATADLPPKNTLRAVRHAAAIAQALVFLGHVPELLLDTIEPLLEPYWTWRTACSLSWTMAIRETLIRHREENNKPRGSRLRVRQQQQEQGQKRGTMLPTLMKAMNDHAEEAMNLGFDKRSSLSKVYQLIITLEMLKGAAPSSSSPPVLQEESWTDSFREVVKLAQEQWNVSVAIETRRTSSSQVDVYKTLVSIGYDCELESLVHGLSVDVVVKGHTSGDVENSKIIVEVDGMWHFARNETKLVVGNTLWKKRLLESAGWGVVNVNVNEWMRKRGAQERREFLQRLIDVAVARRQRRRVEEARRVGGGVGRGGRGRGRGRGRGVRGPAKNNSSNESESRDDGSN